jgi:peptidoglycan/LPS O-acetylase OafA/YrhL
MNEATHIKPLTALRFYAAMWVVLFHYWPKLAVGWTPDFVLRGYLGVELFFVLSGFILCHVYLPALETGRFRYGSFLWARLARVYPLHLATLAGVGLMAFAAVKAGFGIDPTILSWTSLPANLFMVHAWGLAPEAGWNHPSWSISAEWFAYLAFPIFGGAALALKSRPWAAVAAAVALMAALYVAFPLLSGFPLTQATIAWGALRIVPCFALGCAAYLLWQARPVGGQKAAMGLCGAFLAAIVAMAALGAPDLLIVPAFGAVIYALACLTSSGSSLGTSRLGVWLGEVSYGVYMVCVPWKLLFVNAAVKLGGFEGEVLPLWLWLVFLVSVIPVAAAAHHIVERPARSAMKAWAARSRSHAPKFA